MPLNGIGSYVTTMDEFSEHWDETNIELGGTPETELKLQGGFTRAMFLTMRADLDTAITQIVDVENGWELAIASRDQKKSAILGRINQFRGVLRGLLPNSIYLSSAPLVPSLGLSESKFLAPFDDLASLWGRINADATIPGFTPPLLIGALTRAAFVTELADVRAAYAAVAAAESDLDIARKRRDAMLPLARERMVQYRELVPALLGPDHPLSQSLPSITPAPGSTPGPVTLSVVWNAELGQAVLTWTASTNPNLQGYEIRATVGPTYNEEESSHVSTEEPGTLTLATLFGLENSGDQVTFKVFVQLITGNQAGSNAVTITRP